MEESRTLLGVHQFMVSLLQAKGRMLSFQPGNLSCAPLFRHLSFSSFFLSSALPEASGKGWSCGPQQRSLHYSSIRASPAALTSITNSKETLGTPRMGGDALAAAAGLRATAGITTSLLLLLKKKMRVLEVVAAVAEEEGTPVGCCLHHYRR